METKITLLGHTIKVDIDLDSKDSVTRDSIIDNINQAILDGNDSGFSDTSDNDSFEWNIVEEKSYLDKKVEILEEKDEVVFEHSQLIYQVFLRCDGDYDVNVYDLSTNFTSGDELEVTDGGCCSGSAKDAVYFMIDQE